MNGFGWKTARHWIEIIWFPMILFLIGAMSSYFIWRLEYVRALQLNRVEMDSKQEERIKALADSYVALQQQIDRRIESQRLIEAQIVTRLTRIEKVLDTHVLGVEPAAQTKAKEN